MGVGPTRGPSRAAGTSVGRTVSTDGRKGMTLGRWVSMGIGNGGAPASAISNSLTASSIVDSHVSSNRCRTPGRLVRAPARTVRLAARGTLGQIHQTPISDASRRLCTDGRRASPAMAVVTANNSWGSGDHHDEATLGSIATTRYSANPLDAEPDALGAVRAWLGVVHRSAGRH